jgi:hypothetical protein
MPLRMPLRGKGECPSGEDWRWAQRQGREAWILVPGYGRGVAHVESILILHGPRQYPRQTAKERSDAPMNLLA